jgi:hypothetical protein
MELESEWDEGSYHFKKYTKIKPPKNWNYCVLEVYKGPRLISSLERNYPNFPYEVFKHPSGKDYLLCSLSYSGMTCVDLSTGEVQSANTYWCMAAFNTHYQRPYVAVEGCYWGGGYSVRLYDLSSPMKLPWPLVWSNDGNLENTASWQGDELHCRVSKEYCAPFQKYYDDLTDEEEEEAEKMGVSWDLRYLDLKIHLDHIPPLS